MHAEGRSILPKVQELSIPDDLPKNINSHAELQRFYLDCAKVHVFVVEVSALGQFGKVALGEGKPENKQDAQLMGQN